MSGNRGEELPICECYAFGLALMNTDLDVMNGRWNGKMKSYVWTNYKGGCSGCQGMDAPAVKDALVYVKAACYTTSR